MGKPKTATFDLMARVAGARVESGALALWYTGGAGYIIKTAGVTILIDPFLGPGIPPDWVRAIPPAFTPERIDDVAAVVLTHEHEDHADPVALSAVNLRTSSVIFGPESAVTVARSTGVPAERCHCVHPDQSTVIGDLQLTAVTAYDPLARGCLGWVMETGPVTVLHCGDSLYFPGFWQLA
jgi:L-ascorbate 6-phosphate lactonase